MWWGRLMGGSGFGVVIHPTAAAGGIVNIGAGATINGGASGVALRDGDANIRPRPAIQQGRPPSP